MNDCYNIKSIKYMSLLVLKIDIIYIRTLLNTDISYTNKLR